MCALSFFPLFLRHRQAHMLQPVKLSGFDSFSDLRRLKHRRNDDDDHRGSFRYLAGAPNPASSFFLRAPAFRYICNDSPSFKAALLLFHQPIVAETERQRRRFVFD